MRAVGECVAFAGSARDRTLTLGTNDILGRPGASAWKPGSGSSPKSATVPSARSLSGRPGRATSDATGGPGA
jgi:hypothetical protein